MAELPDGTPMLGEMTGYIMGRNKMAGEFNKEDKFNNVLLSTKEYSLNRTYFFPKKILQSLKLHFVLEFSCY